MSFLLRLTTSKGSEHILVACLQTLWGFRCSFPIYLRFLWGKGDQELYQWDHRGEVSGKGPMSPGGTVTETLWVAKSSPLCQLLLFFKPFGKSGPYVPMQWKPCFIIKHILWSSQENLAKSKSHKLGHRDAFKVLCFCHTAAGVSRWRLAVCKLLSCKTQVPRGNLIPVKSFQKPV